jgi:hypothetical protein
MCLISKAWSNALDGHWLPGALEDQARSDWRETSQAVVAQATRAAQRPGEATKRCEQGLNATQWCYNDKAAGPTLI